MLGRGCPYLHVDHVQDVEQLEEPQQRQDDAQRVVLALAAVHGVVGGQQQVHRALTHTHTDSGETETSRATRSRTVVIAGVPGA